MTHWSMTTEIFSLILIGVLLLQFYERDVPQTEKRRKYQLCLGASITLILLNITTVLAMETQWPGWLEMLLNSLYYMMCTVVCSVIADYLFVLVLEHVYRPGHLRRIRVALVAMNVVYACFLLWNVSSGMFFYFDEDLGYHRGPLYAMGYAILVVELALLLGCYLRHRNSVSRAMNKLMQVLPVVSLMMVLFQLAYPDALLNGALVAVADLLLFISFQTTRTEADSLTMVGNRNSFFDELTLRLADGHRFQLILVDLRHFSAFNQKYGHPRGDEMLYQVARELSALLPQSRAFRFNSVEFTVLLPWNGETQAADNLIAVRKRMEARWEIGAVSCYLEHSIAELEYRGQAWSATQTIEYLEYTLECAVKAGVGSAVSFNEAVRVRFERRKALLRLLHQAIQKQSFQVWYQPIWTLGSGFRSAEALLRLNDEEGRPVSPGEFIPLAEEFGMIEEISWIVLEKVCALLSRTGPEQLDSISVNVSMQQFVDYDLIRHIRECLQRYGVAPERLKLEITERVLMENAHRTREIMQELNKMGVEFYLDDFGTGYSNLSSVLDLPFQVVKLDYSLLNGFPGNVRSEMLVKSMTELFHSMQFVVVAEGVEQRFQADCLERLGVDRIQGYYYSHPLPESEFQLRLASAQWRSTEPAEVQTTF